jgi:hypothetical protein
MKYFVILIGTMLSLLLGSIAYSATGYLDSDGDCWGWYYHIGSVASAYTHDMAYHDAIFQDGQWIDPGTTTIESAPQGTPMYRLSIYNYESIDGVAGYTMVSNTFSATYISHSTRDAIIDWMTQRGIPYATAPNHNDYTECEPNAPCNLGDDDQDGICNECDQLPGEPDPDDCIIGIATDKATDEEHAYIISSGCTGGIETGEWYTTPSYNENNDYRYHLQISGGITLSPKNCGDDPEECCTYQQGNSSVDPSDLEQGSIPQGVLDLINNLPTPEEILDKDSCTDLKAVCRDKTCGGQLAYFSCSQNSDGGYDTQCFCQDDYSVSQTTPSSDNTPVADSDNDGIPDAADPDQTGDTDSDGDGIADSADVDQVGGPDLNQDGIADSVSYTPTRSEQDLRDIADNTSSLTDSLVDSKGQSYLSQVKDLLSGKTSGVLDNVHGEMEDVNHNLNDIESILTTGVQVDLGTNNGTESLPTENTYDADLSVDNLEYTEEVEGGFGQVVTDFITNGMPLSDVISGTGASIASSSSTLSFTLYGSNIVVDFSDYSDVLQMIGVILYGIACIASILILVR